MGFIELVLHIEQPHTRRRTKHHHGQMHHQKGRNANHIHHHQSGNQNAGIGAKHTEPGRTAILESIEREALRDEENIDRPQAEQHQRMAVEPVFEAAPKRQRLVFRQRQRVDIADAAPVKIAGAHVMLGMGMLPIVIGREREKAQGAAHPVISLPGGEQRQMPAIMLNHEQPHQKRRRGNGKGQRGPGAVTIKQPTCHPKRQKRCNSDGNFNKGASVAGHTVRCQAFGPGFSCVQFGLPTVENS